MEQMDKDEIKDKIKRILGDYKRTKNRKEAAAEELKAIQTDMIFPLKSISGDITGIRGSGEGDPINSCINELMEMEMKYTKEIISMAAALKKIESLVDLIPEGSEEKTVVRQKYICCKNWTDVRRKLGYEKSKCYYIMDNALSIISEKVVEGGVEL